MKDHRTAQVESRRSVSPPEHQDLETDQDPEEEASVSSSSSSSKSSSGESLGRTEALVFPTNCPSCERPGEVAMCILPIPHFSNALLMSIVCEFCGYKTSEIKNGGIGDGETTPTHQVSEYGLELELTLSTPEDLNRPILQSETASLSIRELEIYQPQSSGEGAYTTVEGLLRKLKDQLAAANPFARGDPSLPDHPSHSQFQNLLQRLDDLAEGKYLPVTLILRDPMGESFIGPPSNADHNHETDPTTLDHPFGRSTEKARAALAKAASRPPEEEEDYDYYGVRLTRFVRSPEEKEGLGIGFDQNFGT